MKYHCRDRENRTLSIHSSVEKAYKAREVWLHTRELIWISDNTGRLLTANEVFQAAVNLWLEESK